MKRFLVVSFVMLIKFNRSFGSEAAKKAIVNFVGKLVEDSNLKNPNIVQDVVLINLGNNLKSELFDRIIERIPKNNAIMIQKAGQIVKNQTVRPAEFIIIVSNVVDKVSS